MRLAKHTVNELAHSLAVTDNAVRVSLSRLERRADEAARQRATFRKPKAVYDITPQAECLFARAYVPVLITLLGVLEST